MKFFKKHIFIILLFVATNTLAQKKNDSHLEYNKVCNIDVKNDTLPNYIVSLKERLHTATLNKNNLKVAEYSLLLATIYYKLNSTELAIGYNLDALKGFEKAKDTSFIISSLSSLIRIYQHTENDSIALEYAKKALKIGYSLKKQKLIGRCYLNISTIYMSFDKEKGITNLVKAINLGEQVKDNEGLVVMYNNFGYYYSETRKLDSANFYYQKSLNLMEDKNSYKAGVYANMAKLEYQQMHYEKSLEYAKKSLNYVENITVFSDIDDAYKLLVKASVKIGKYKDAFNYYEYYIKNQQKDISNRKSDQAGKLKILYEIDKFESKIELLDNENKLKTSKLFFVTIILTFIGLVLFFIFFQNQKIKKSYKKIVDESIKSLIIEDENEELKSLLEKSNTNQTLNIDKKENELFVKIKNIIEKEKLYKNPLLNLNIISDKLETNRSYVSKAINDGSNKSFVEFINEYRIIEAKKLLNSTDAQILTLEAIGEKAGFNSKSTFFRVFKSVVGVTPSFFAKNIDV